MSITCGHLERNLCQQQNVHVKSYWFLLKHSPFAVSALTVVSAQSYMPNGRKWKDDVPKDLAQWPWRPW